VSDPVLVADVGGTNVRFALSEKDDPLSVASGDVSAFEAAALDSLVDGATQYLDRLDKRPRAAVLACAGPVRNQQVRLTNSPWVISAGEVRERLGLDWVHLVNDFAAMSAALPVLPRAYLGSLGKPEVPVIDLRRPAVFAVIGPGTGLGVSALLVREGKMHIIETEGGHTGFAPETREEIGVCSLLMRRFGRVSNERLLSGPGLLNLYTCLCEIDGVAVELATPEQVTDAADAASSVQAREAVEMFCSILGSVAGDVVMTCGAWQGIFLAGGVITELLPWLERGDFRERFEQKGRLSATMEPVPTVAVTHELAGLVGAAAIAARRM
jgi:glucokinase